MNFTIRKAAPQDIPGIMALVKELALFEKAPQEVINTEAKMLEDGFGDAAIFKAFVAEHQETGEVVGVCLYYTAYSTWKGKYYFLDDIVVREPFRQHGLGRKLMHELIQEANDLGIPQIRWQVLDWNKTAIKFYESLGAFVDKEWYTCKMSSTDIANYLNKN